jgi:hypothetical protein
MDRQRDGLSVLNIERAVQENIEILRASVHLRESVSKHKDLAGKPMALENRYDRQFKVVFDAIRGLMKQRQRLSTRSGLPRASGLRALLYALDSALTTLNSSR